MVGIGRGARRGILIRDIDALQSAQRIDTIVLDKTGTITQGKPVVSRIVSLNGPQEHEILRLAAGAEQYSEHPLAKAIVKEAQRLHLEIPEVESFNNDPGFGVIATVAGKPVLAGNSALLKKHGLSDPDSVLRQKLGDEAIAFTTVHVATPVNSHVEHLGTIALADQLKPDSAAAIKELHNLGLRTVLLTGDNRPTAEHIAKEVGIDDVRAEVKPDEKAQVIRELQRSPDTAPTSDILSYAGPRPSVAMVGDGINDAPALATADLGIAIGSGSDIAKETGDIVLVSGSLHGIATAIRLSRATMRTIRQNLFFAFLYNVLAIPLAALGFLNPLIAAAAMALSDVTVLGNSLLLRRSKID
jgi:Cu+-exporting ATPase